MEIYFMRHGPLQSRFSDYSKLSYEDFNDLLLKKKAPNIDMEKTKGIVAKLKFLPSCKKIFCSTQNRAIQTAEIVHEFVTADIIKTSLLDEVNFLEGIITKEDTNKGMENIRRVVLTNWYKSKYSEKFKESIARLQQFLDTVNPEKYGNIVCVTHAWFMRVIQIYAEDRTLNNISLQRVLTIKPAENGGVIKINLPTQ